MMEHLRLSQYSSTPRDSNEPKGTPPAARDSEDLYRDLTEYSQDLLCTHDLEGRLLSVNPTPARILGYSMEELLQVPMRDLLVPQFRDQFDEYLARIRRDGFAKGVIAIQTQTGERRIWEYHNTLRTEGVAAPIVCGIAHDVTEQRKAQQQLILKLRETTLLSTLGHRLSRGMSLSSVVEAAIDSWGTVCSIGTLFEMDETFESPRPNLIECDEGFPVEVLGRSGIRLIGLGRRGQ